MVQLHRDSKKKFPHIFDCMGLIIFFGTGIGISDLTQHVVGGVAEWLERWSRPANFRYPVPDC